jgi:hypothetical protein
MANRPRGETARERGFLNRAGTLTVALKLFKIYPTNKKAHSAKE